jgi:hypothetical protein
MGGARNSVRGDDHAKGTTAVKRVLDALTVAVVLALVSCSVAAADVFVLVGGGRVVGEQVNPNQSPRESYAIKTSSGVQITLARSRVLKHLRPRPDEIEYERMRPRYPDTVEGQWTLAEWCREHTLLSERNTHLERILDLEPDHEKARRALGYFMQNGEWTTEEKVRKEDGWVRYKGRWRLPQEVERMKEREGIKDVQNEWKQKVNRWREWLAGNKGQEAYRNFQQIKDPAAVAALAAALREDVRGEARLLFIEALARIGTPEAVEVLAVRSLADPVSEVRLTCLDYLKRMKDPGAVDNFIDALGNRENILVNRAAVALRHLEAKSAIGPLIDALITIHKFKITSGNPGQMSTTFGSGGAGGGAPGGLSMGGDGPKIVKQPIPNQAVLDALVSLAGVDYGFDVGRWKAWYAAQRRRSEIDTRRD